VSYDRKQQPPVDGGHGTSEPGGPGPGKRTLTELLPSAGASPAAVQRKATADGDAGGETVADKTSPGKESASAASGAASPSLQGGDQLLQGGIFRMEGATLFSGPDPAITASAPPATTADKTSDTDFEDALGVSEAIKNKSMLPVTGVHGQTFTAVGCAGKKDGKVSFTFDRAYIGDHVSTRLNKSVRGVSVSIAVKLENCGEHKEVKLVQILRNIEKKSGAMVAKEPDSETRKKRSGWDDDKAKSRGWRVDEVDSGKSPFYVTDDFYGDNGSSTKPSKLRDAPFDWTTDTNMGKEFRTCAVSYADGKGTVLACIDWGYYIDDKGAATFYPTTPTAYVGAVAELTDAAARWDAISGNTKANIVK